jgi:predicted ATPase/class 3 adenylate cyclase/predicted negative regulator of RcsB-dependent stress response
MQTFLFTDIEGSTRRWSRAPVAMADAVQQQEHLLKRTIEGAGGRVFKSVGDGVYAVFASPVDAVRVAVAAQRALLAERWDGLADDDPIQVRIGVHTGAAEERDGDYFGPTLNRLSRLMDAGHGGQILCTAETVTACGEHWPEEIGTRDLGERTLRDVPGSGRIFQLVADGLPEQFPPLETLDPRVHNLPRWPSAMVGRVDEQRRLRQLLRSRESSLVSVVGTGGVGKTRLTTEVAAQLLDEFQHGIRFVDLSALREDAQVLPAIVQVTGAADPLLPPSDALLDWLRNRELLLVLDNCEQVVAGVADICSEIVQAAPGVTILATSRVPIRIRGERRLALEPLPTGDDGPTNAAVQLFVERAIEVDETFAPAAGVAEEVADICRMVDGLPLAIELAAAWVRILTPEALHRRLRESRAILRDGARDLPDRQRTLTNTIAWSYDLLEPEDQRAFRRLAVFRGGIAVDAAAAVIWEAPVTDPLWALSRLDALVQANLLRVTPDPTGEPRFLMLQTIQEFAIGVLREFEEWNDAASAHAEFFARLSEEAHAHYRANDVAFWLDRLDHEFENLRASIEHFADLPGHRDRGIEMAVALWEFLDQRGHEPEARAWLTMVFKESPDIPARLRARAQLLLGNCWFSNPEQAETLYLHAATAAREAGDDRLLRMIEGSLAMASSFQGKVDEAITILVSITDQERGSGDEMQLGDALMHLAQAYCDASRFADALEALDEANKLALDPSTDAWFDLIRGRVLRRMGQQDAALVLLERARAGFATIEATLSVARCLYEMGAALLHRDLPKARSYVADANDHLGENPDPYTVSAALETNASILAAEGLPELAATILASANAWRSTAGFVLSRPDLKERDALIGRIVETMAPERNAFCVTAGGELTLRAAIELATATVRANAEAPV